MFTMFPANASIPVGAPVKFGIDPTFPRLHLGHFVPIRQLKKLQEQGHFINIVLGTFTAQLGDPSGRDATRPILTAEAVKTNAEAIAGQLKKILHPNFLIRCNNNWHDATSLPDFMKSVAKFTLAHLTSRDSFQKRIENGNSIGMHELLVPICQGLDSVHLQAEIEVGGNDQLFNFQITRQLQEAEGQKPQVCLMFPIINGTDGRKMSKSFDNCIWLDEEPNSIFGKTMRISDETMLEWCKFFTDFDPTGRHPMDSKKLLARSIVSQLHSEEVAQDAEAFFTKTIQNREVPEDIGEFESATILDTIIKMRTCSKSQARRLIKDGGVRVDDIKVTDETQWLKPGQIIRIGSRGFAKIK